MGEYENYASIVPLINFDSDAELVKLTERLCLRRIDSAELLNLLKKFRDETPYLTLLEANYVIEDKNLPPSAKNAKDIVLALRLLKEGDVIVLATFHLHKGNRVSLGIHDDLFRMSPFWNPYFLKKEESIDFIELWKKVQDMTSKPYLKFPLDKFTEAYDEDWFEKKIVEYMVAFESLIFYQRDKSIEPAGEVIGIAIGMLIGNNQQERQKIKKTLENAYELRNAVVHGNLEKLKKWSNMKQLSVEVEDYLRRTLRKFIEE